MFECMKTREVEQRRRARANKIESRKFMAIRERSAKCEKIKGTVRGARRSRLASDQL